MKRTLSAVLLLVSAVFLLPLAALLWSGSAAAWTEAGAENAENTDAVGSVSEGAAENNATDGETATDAVGSRNTETSETASGAAETETGTKDASVTLTALLDGEERTLTLEEYLWGVVAAEMPASFEPEALKAQAIAARTYTLYRLAHPKGTHSTDLCGDYTCCQAWISQENRMESWGDDAETYAEKITAAIRDTDGEIAVSGGEPILAVFHASSGGKTRSAEEVWGGSYSYLTAVESPEGEEVPNYYSTVTVSAEEFREKLTAAYPEADLSGDVSAWLGAMTWDEGGLPLTLEVGGVEIPTKELRTLFGLRSATLTAEVQDGNVVFSVTGYGHGVGMSQYGANVLAKEGKTAEEIIQWYYTGAEIGSL